MRRQKKIIIIASLLLLGLFVYLFFHSTQTEQVSVETYDSVWLQHIENAPSLNQKEEQRLMSDDSTSGEEGKLKSSDENSKRTITEEIKEKIREAVEGTINLFKKDLKIVAIGDSLTQGVGDETESGGYVGILNNTFEDNNLNIKIENYGKKGNRTDQLLKRLEKEEIVASISKADLVFITIGANDIMKVVKSNFTNLKLELFEEERLDYIERLKAIFDKINEINPDTQIYLIGFYNPFELYFEDIEELALIMNRWNEAGRLVTEEYENVNYIPVADLFSQRTIELLADDYFHPNTTGYKLMAKRVLENVDEVSIETEITTESTAESESSTQQETTTEEFE
ncbi:SGNH/GDSL hydrolase family protein [Mesobacillus maritimus]|uniref:SGNH/GDSL hydrolase family protein n=1 Tax=Mesobacillus maritimus TaxID=1643336 RepID=A0ABS7KBF7_9BACI|nr:SGNH/GDSL hydrolase family protein [Mesobacillus maritimus]MBY0099606.1 SGNH/GDSL hydrolase family protein [Mesobacillus maritimus]